MEWNRLNVTQPLELRFTENKKTKERVIFDFNIFYYNVKVKIILNLQKFSEKTIAPT